MAKLERFGSIKRFGARYGTKVKNRFGEVEKEQRRKHKCPYCSAVKVKRVAVGIWYCHNCETKFTGKAYTISGKISPKEEETKNG